MSTRPVDGERISVGVDGSAESRAALRWVLERANDHDVVTLVHVWNASPTMVDAGLCDGDDDTAAKSLAHRELLRAMELLSDPSVVLRTSVLHGDPRHELCDLDTDLLVLGSRGRSGVVGCLLGSVAGHVTRHASVPVVIVPSPRPGK